MHPTLGREEIAQRGKELYQQIRTNVEAENLGKIVSIDVQTGDYAIGNDLVETSLQLRTKHANAAIWAERIGFDAVFAVGGTLVRTV